MLNHAFAKNVTNNSNLQSGIPIRISLRLDYLNWIIAVFHELLLMPVFDITTFPRRVSFNV